MTLCECIDEFRKETHYQGEYLPFVNHFISIEHDDGTIENLKDFLKVDKQNRINLANFEEKSIIFPEVSSKFFFNVLNYFKNV